MNHIIFFVMKKIGVFIILIFLSMIIITCDNRYLYLDFSEWTKSVISDSNIKENAPADTIAPVPGSLGNISVSETLGNSIHLSWSYASDNITVREELAYQVYYSSYDTIDTIEKAEIYGVKVQDWKMNINNLVVDGLTTNTSYHFTVLVKDMAGNKANYVMITAATNTMMDTQSPAPGNLGMLNISNFMGSYLTLNWTFATDNGTSVNNLLYSVVLSTADNINTVADAHAYGTIVNNYTPNYNSFVISGLLTYTTYYFNVLVKDLAGNEAIYTRIMQITDPEPPIPGDYGQIYFNNLQPTSFTLTWAEGSDNYTTQYDLCYEVVMSFTNNIETPFNAQKNGSVVMGWTYSVSSYYVYSLTEGQSYYFTVLIKDSAGNMAVYNTINIFLDATAPQPGNYGQLTITNLQQTSLNLSWAPAVDNLCSQNELMYKVVYSHYNDIYDPYSVDMFTLVNDWSYNITNTAVYGLQAASPYYFAVIVKDKAENRSLYSIQYQVTPSDPITFDFSNYMSKINSNTFNMQHTISSGTNRILLVAVYAKATSLTMLTITNISYYGNTMMPISGASINQYDSGSGNYYQINMYYLPDTSLPMSGNYPIDILFSGTVTGECYSISLQNVDQAGPNYSTTNYMISANNISTSINANYNESWLVDMVGSGLSGTFNPNSTNMVKGFELSSNGMTGSSATKKVTWTGMNDMSWVFSGSMSLILHAVVVLNPAGVAY